MSASEGHIHGRPDNKDEHLDDVLGRGAGDGDLYPQGQIQAMSVDDLHRHQQLVDKLLKGNSNVTKPADAN